MRKCLILLILSGYLTSAGCALFVAGAGAGAGVYAYFNGELKRTYPAGLNRVEQETEAALKELKITTTDKTDAENSIKLTAQRTDGVPVTIRISGVDPGVTEVAIRSGVVGVWDRKASELIHASIAKRLQ